MSGKTDDALLAIPLTVIECETLIAAWNGDPAAINSEHMSRVIEAVADQLDRWEAHA